MSMVEVFPVNASDVNHLFDCHKRNDTISEQISDAAEHRVFARGVFYRHQQFGYSIVEPGSHLVPRGIRLKRNKYLGEDPPMSAEEVVRRAHGPLQCYVDRNPIPAAIPDPLAHLTFDAYSFSPCQQRMARRYTYSSTMDNIALTITPIDWRLFLSRDVDELDHGEVATYADAFNGHPLRRRLDAYGDDGEALMTIEEIFLQWSPGSMDESFYHFEQATKGLCA